MSFLQKSAQHIFNKFTNLDDFQNVCVVLPTRRSVYFFKRALAQCADRPFLAPEVIAIDDFVAQRCGVQIADNVSLLFELYDIYKHTDSHVNFEQYLGWAGVLLQDFDRIDQYLIDPKYLFSYMTEARALERWRVDWPKSNIKTENNSTKKHFELFANLHEVYHKFQQHLSAQSKAYRGMAYRTLAENTYELLLSQSSVSQFFFIGFNALSTSELTIVQTLIKAKKAECLWDTDHYYMRNNGRVEGGKLLRQYREAGWAGEWLWSDNLLLDTHRQLHAYAVPNASMQTKVAGDLYRQWQTEGFGGSDDQPVAIVLADENMLVPMLYSLDANVTDLNVTMGLSLRNSLLFTLIDSLFELQLTIGEFRTKDGRDVKIPKFNHRTVEKVLNHPFIRRYEFLALQGRDSHKPTIIQNTIRHIQQNNVVYLDTPLLLELGENHELFQLLFTRWKDKPQPIIQIFYGLIDLLREVYKETQNAVETEYLYLFYTILKQLESTLVGDHVEKLNLRTFKSFLYELIRQSKIPFSGEPLSALQVIGMLETRTLDFDRIIVLSMNEGVLPTTKRQNSLIAWDIAQEVGLPTYSDQDAVMSYHFYRLLQRAKEVHFVYTTDPNTYNGGEPSRFLMQLEYELANQPNSKTTFTKHQVVFDDKNPENDTNDTTPKSNWTILKNDETMAFLRTQLTEKGLYATHFSQYLKCSLQYYFNRVVGVSEDEEVEDKVGVSDFGTWIHQVLEAIDIAYFMQNKTPSDAEIEVVLREEFQKLFGSFDADTGPNRLLFKVAKQITTDFLHQQIKQNNDINVLATERKLETTLNIKIGTETLPIKIAGKIDRIELLNNTIRVADYKTGKIETFATVKSEKIEELLLEKTDGKSEKIRQLWLYKYLIYKQMQSINGLNINNTQYRSDAFGVNSGFYSLRNIKAGYIENAIQFENENAEVYIEESERYLRQFLEIQLLNTAEPFQKTNDLAVCQYCDYRGICGR